MLRVLLALLFVSATALAETKNNFTYVEAGYADTGVYVLVFAEEYGEGQKFTGSWQFLPQWFVSYSDLRSDGRDDDTNQKIEANEQALSLGYIFTSTRKSDFYGRIGRVHRELPDTVVTPFPFPNYTEQVEYDSTSVAIGARHRLLQRLELSWGAETLLGAARDARGIVSIRFFATDSFSLGFQGAFGSDLAVTELNARYQF